MASVPALELDTEASGYTRLDGVHFGGFPGVWEPGRPVAISELGFDSDEEALARVAELELPLRETTVDSAEGAAAPRPNHLLSEDQQRALELADEGDQKKRWTHKELDALAAAAELTWPDEVRSVAEKREFLDNVEAGAVTTSGDDLATDEGAA